MQRNTLESLCRDIQCAIQAMTRARNHSNTVKDRISGALMAEVEEVSSRLHILRINSGSSALIGRPYALTVIEPFLGLKVILISFSSLT